MSETTQTEAPAPASPAPEASSTDSRFSALVAAGEAHRAARSAPTSAPSPVHEEPTTEPSGEPAEAEPASSEEPAVGDTAVATSWAELNRRDAALKEQASALKSQERQLQEYQAIQNAKGDPLRLLQALGYNRTQILDAVIAQDGAQQPQQIDPGRYISREEADAKVQAVKAELGEHNRIRNALAQSDAELLKLAADSENGDKVMEEILLEAADEYSRTRTRPNYAEIIKRKEGEYERQTFGLLEFLGRSTKVKDRLAGQTTPPGKANPPQPGPSAKPKQQNASPPSTLSNDMQTEPAPHNPAPKTVAEKRAAFVQAIADGWKAGKKGAGTGRSH